jgi:hypothetical protein
MGSSSGARRVSKSKRRSQIMEEFNQILPFDHQDRVELMALRAALVGLQARLKDRNTPQGEI